jgi:GTP cyclohydrolase II
MNKFRSPFDQGVSARHSDPASRSLKEVFGLRAAEELLRVKGDLRLGLPVILRHGADRRLVVFVEPLDEERFHALAGLGPMELVLTSRRAAAIGAPASLAGEAVCLPVPQGAVPLWPRSLAGLEAAGLAAEKIAGTGFTAGGPVEAAILGLAKAARVLPAALAVRLDATTARAGLTEMDVASVTDALRDLGAQERVSSALLPMGVSDAGRVHVFRPDDGEAEHYAIEIGEPDFAQPVTLRLHSACFTGDVLGSLKCDCGPQLRAAMAAMAESGGGVLLYLNQEGRGIGMANKMRAYALQERGLDTVEANHWLGFEDDQRDFRIGVQILRQIGIGRVRLMTNNPAKLAMLQDHGIEVVEHIPLKVGRTVQNTQYLATKAAKSGHLL